MTLPPRQILHLDMDAFFASVEQRDFPELRGQPVVVGGRSGRGVVSAASYEARKFGIHSAMSMSQALKRCPSLLVQPGRMAVYKDVSRSVFDIFHRYTDLVEKLSVDEAFLDVTGCQRLHGTGREIAEKIRSEVWKEVSLTVSAGIAPNKFLAKLASDVNKPDGLFELSPEEIDPFLLSLPIKRLWGVGPKAQERLQRYGIETVADLREYSIEWLEQQMGSWGPRLYDLCRGQDDRSVETETEIQSIGHEDTYSRDLCDSDRIRQEILHLTERVTMRARKKGVRGKTLTVKVRYGDFKTCTRSATLPHPTDQTMPLYHQAMELLEKTEAMDRPVRLLGVTLGNLGEDDQVELFESPNNKDNENLDRAIDSVRDRFGKIGLVRGSLLDRGKK